MQRAKEATERVIAAARALRKSLMRHLFTYGPVPMDQVNQVRLKETEIGPLPEGWEVVRLRQLEKSKALLLKNGFACGTHNDVGVGVPQLRPMNINQSGDITLDNLKYVETNEDLSRYLLQANDVIFNNTNSEELVGKTGIWLKDGKFVVSNHMTIIRVLKPEVIEPYYLARHLHWKWLNGYYRSICRRYVAQAGVSLERLRHVSIPLPPLPEQRAIAEMLRAVERKIEAEEGRKAALEALFKTLLHHLMTGKVRWHQDVFSNFLEASYE